MNWTLAFSIFMQLMPVIKTAVETVSKATGKSPEAAVQDVINHMSPGHPNAPALDFQAPKG